MSLINAMLADLDARRGGVPQHADQVLHDLAPAQLPAAGRRWRKLAGACVLVAAGTAVAFAAGRLPGLQGAAGDASATTDRVPPVARAVAAPARSGQEPRVPVPHLAAAVPPAGAPPVPVPVLLDPPAATGEPVRTAGGPLVEPRPATGPAGETGVRAGGVSGTGAPPASETQTGAGSTIGAVPWPEPGPDPDPALVAEAFDPAPVAGAPEAAPARVAITPSTGPLPPDADGYRVAAQLLRQGRGHEGVARVSEYLQAHPDHIEARLLLASARATQARLDDARAVLAEGVRRRPREPRLAMPLARLLVDAGQESQALAVLDAAAGATSGDAEYQAFIGALAQRLGDHRRAAQAYRAALERGPQQGTWWLGLGISLAAEDRRRQAYEAFRRALGDRSLAPALRRFAAERAAALEAESGPG